MPKSMIFKHFLPYVSDAQIQMPCHMYIKVV